MTVIPIRAVRPCSASKAAANRCNWEPFNLERDGDFNTTRNLYKNVLGNKLRFEEFNHDLKLVFRYTWVFSDSFGFARQCELENTAQQTVRVEVVDGLQNILPAGTPRFAQTNTSNLVDAYKWTELDEETGIALFTLYSGITDRAEPSESLRANTVFCINATSPKILLSSNQLEAFRQGEAVHTEVHRRGIRGAYFVHQAIELAANSSDEWAFVADVELSQADVVALRHRLADPKGVSKELADSVNAGSDELARIMANSDGFQLTSEDNVSVHHYANVLFNVLRGGIFDDQYNISRRDFALTVRHFNDAVFKANQAMLGNLPETLDFNQLLKLVKKQNDPQLERLCQEYLPVTFARRHGDPSRPWNQFSIKLKDGDGNRLLSYEGNWRDIFQNWEALAFSYPEFVENIIAKFVNASTIDGYNPYRITKEGIDWEVEEPDDPWSYIGYWGDHQIIYLQKLLELSAEFHPSRLSELLHEPVFSYANVPYRIKPFEALVKNPKSTVVFDEQLAERIDERLAEMGADGKLVLDESGSVYQVTLLEKLLVPLLSKLGNLVIDGGVWMNTQRPEWNDANNALVGQGLSMVTLYYLRRYVCFLQRLLANENRPALLSAEVGLWLRETAAALSAIRPLLGGSPLNPKERYKLLAELGRAASRYRQAVYQQETFSGKSNQPLPQILSLLGDAQAAIDHSINTNRRADGLYHAYNLLHIKDGAVEVDNLYPMLEGQVAALSAESLAPGAAVEILEALFASDIYRADQHSFMLYPDRHLPRFLEKNRIGEQHLSNIPILSRMLEQGDTRVVLRDADDNIRFNADFTNVGDLNACIDKISLEYGDEIESARASLQALFEDVFDHKAFTGRSGTMFGFEGLGSIYWHMVSKLLLAVQENYFSSLEQTGDDLSRRRLGQLYYRVREGIGFNKSPAEFGAFPTDPYSHTPMHAGAQQPGMTGQAKEEVLTRFGELGIRVGGGVAKIQPKLLRKREFLKEKRVFRYLDVHGNWQEIPVSSAGLAFTWCQVPVIYTLNDQAEPGLIVTWANGEKESMPHMELSSAASQALFRRSGQVRQLDAVFTTGMLFDE